MGTTIKFTYYRAEKVETVPRKWIAIGLKLKLSRYLQHYHNTSYVTIMD